MKRGNFRNSGKNNKVGLKSSIKNLTDGTQRDSWEKRKEENFQLASVDNHSQLTINSQNKVFPKTDKNYRPSNLPSDKSQISFSNNPKSENLTNLPSDIENRKLTRGEKAGLTSAFLMFSGIGMIMGGSSAGKMGIFYGGTLIFSIGAVIALYLLFTNSR